MIWTKSSFVNAGYPPSSEETRILQSSSSPRIVSARESFRVSIFGYIMTFLEFRAINACCS